YDLRLMPSQLINGSFPILCKHWLVVLEGPAQLPLQCLIILHNQQCWRCRPHARTPRCTGSVSAICRCSDACGNMIENTVPRPGALATCTRPPAARTNSRAWNAPMPMPRLDFVV